MPFTFDPYSPEFDANPHEAFAFMRRECPVCWWDTGQAWILTRYDDAAAACRDPRLSANFLRSEYHRAALSRVLDHPLSRILGKALMTLPDADHARIRRLANPMFTPRRMSEYLAGIRREVDTTLSRLAENDSADLAADFAIPLPRRFIMQILGIPDGDRERFGEFAAAVINFAFPATDDNEFERNAKIATEGFDRIGELIARRRNQPGDDILSALIHLNDGGDRLSTEELLPLVAGLVLGAWDTTGQALAFAFLSFLRHPGQAQLLRNRADLIAGAVEETLRFDYFAKLGVFRYAEEDLQIRGVNISRGQCVIACAAAAHRDPDVFPDPARFDITRTPGALLSFGGGAHICIGMALARMVMQEAIGQFVRRFPQAVLVMPPGMTPHPLLRMITSMPVALSGKQTIQPRPLAPQSERASDAGRQAQAVRKTFDELPRLFRADKSAGVHLVIQYNISGDGGVWNVVIKDGACVVHSGPAADPNLTLEISAQDWLEMSSGKRSGTTLLMMGKLKMKGDMSAAMKLRSLFVMP